MVERQARALIELTTSSGVITATVEHPFAKIGSGWTRADRLARGDLIATSHGVPARVVDARRLEAPSTPVFNLVVEGSHTYYVGQARMLVHNLSCLGIFGRDRPAAERSNPTASEPAPLTLQERLELEAYRDGRKLRPPPGTSERRRLDDLEARAPRSVDEATPEDPRERARRWARNNPWPGELPTPRPEPGSLGSSVTVGELINLESYRDGSRLRPPPGTTERRRLDEVEGTVKRLEQSYPEGSPWKPPEDPRERARRWARQNQWPGQWPERPEPGALGSPPTLRELIDLEAYRDGSKLRPPPGTTARRRLDELEALVQHDESVHGSSHGGSSRRDTPQDPSEASHDGGDSRPNEDTRPLQPDSLDSPPTLRELMDLESYRDGTKLRPPPGTPERRRIDAIEAQVKRWEESHPEAAQQPTPDPRERARRWARQVPWPGKPDSKR